MRLISRLRCHWPLGVLPLICAAVLPLISISPIIHHAGAATGAVGGIVVDGLTHQALPGAVVFLMSSSGPASVPRVVTDSGGRFVFSGLSASSTYRLRASKAGYFDGAFQSVSPNDLGAPIVLKADDRVTGLEIDLYPPASLAGQLADEFGDPIAGASVLAVGRIAIGSATQFDAASVSLTDDRGRYELADLPPGEYEVQFVQSEKDRPWIEPSPDENGRPRVYPPTFFPGAESADGAATIALNYGDRRDDINFELTPEPAHTVCGRVGAPSRAAQGFQLRAVRRGSESLPMNATALSQVDLSGSFCFHEMPPGSYVIESGPRVEYSSSGPRQVLVRSSQGSSNVDAGSVVAASAGISFVSMSTPSSAWFRGAVEIGSADVSNITVPMGIPSSIAGLVKFDAPKSVSKIPQEIRIEIDPADGDPRLGLYRLSARPSGEQWRFSASGLRPGRYVLRVSGQVVRSIRTGNDDVTDSPLNIPTGASIEDLELVLASAPAEIHGTVRDSNGASIPDAVVVAFSADSANWSDVGLTPARIKMGRVATDGSYRLPGLPAGKYDVVAVRAAEGASWFRPTFLASAAAIATSVELGWGTEARVDLKRQTRR